MNTDSTISDSTAAEEVSADQPADDAATGHETHDIPDSRFIVIAVILAVLTAIEVAIVEISSFPDGLLVPSLLVLMAIKFYIVIAYFMHLKFDSRLFSVLFYIGLFGAVILYAVMLTTFHFFIS
jgi:cytochrome c oxidase subunit 4